MSSKMRDQGCSPAASRSELETNACKCEGDSQALLDAIPDLIWLKNPDGIYLDCNLAVERILGTEKSDILGKTDYDFLDRSQADLVREQDSRSSISDKPLCTEEWLNFGGAGQRRLYATTKTPMRDASGKLIGILSISRDITERLKRQNSDEQLIWSDPESRYILDYAADAIFIADQQGHYQYANEHAAQFLGYDDDELLRMKIGDITPNEDLKNVLHLFQKLRSTGTLHCELRLRHRNGDNLPVDFNGSILPDGRVYCSYRDIRTRKLAEAERELHHETLVREVHHRVKNNLQGVAGLLQRELGKFKDIDSRLNTAISQINSISVVHALQAVQPDDGVNLYAKVIELCQMASDLALRPVLFQCKDEEHTVSLFRVNPNDAISVALVLNELILNALKHSPPDSRAPEVTLLADGTGVKLVIRNTVAEVPEFNFDTNHKLGTGLSLVRSLLPQQGARLSYQFDSLAGFMLATLCLAPPCCRQSP